MNVVFENSVNFLRLCLCVKYGLRLQVFDWASITLGIAVWCSYKGGEVGWLSASLVRFTLSRF